MYLFAVETVFFILNEIGMLDDVGRVNIFSDTFLAINSSK